jgi:hypothetical protein
MVKARLHDADAQAFALQSLVFGVDIAFVRTRPGFLSGSKKSGGGSA